jgi:hypothetical protein
MSGNFKNEPAYAVIGDLHKQYSFAQTIKSMLEDMFGKQVKNLNVGSKQPFYIYDADANDIELTLEGKTVTLTPQQQGAVAVLRFSVKRKLTSVHKGIWDNAADIFSTDFYNLFVVKQDWDFGPIYDDIRLAIKRNKN